MPQPQTPLPFELQHMEAMTTEELRPALKPYASPMPSQDGFLMLRHPLVYQIPLLMPGYANRQLTDKRRHWRECQSYSDKVWLYERPYRLTALLRWYKRGLIATEELRNIFPSIWIDAERIETNLQETTYELVTLLRSIGFVTDREGMSLPVKPIAIYRGARDDLGVSWSLSLDTARFFAGRWAFGDDSQRLPVFRAVAPPEAILGMVFDRNEREVLVDPWELEDGRILER